MASRKSKAVAAAIALSAIAATGSTLALWDDPGANQPNAPITSGHLDITAQARTVADISPDDTNGSANESIDLSSFHIVPGDVIRIAQPVTVDLNGDNIAAKLAVQTAEGYTLAADPGAGTKKGMYVSKVGVYAGDIDATATSLGTNLITGGVVDFRPGHANGSEPGTANYTLVYEVTFDSATSGKDLQDATATLAGSTLTLEQVRPNQLP